MVPGVLRFLVVDLTPGWSEDNGSLARVQASADSVSVLVYLLIFVRNLKHYGLAMIRFHDTRVILELNLHEPIDSDSFLISKLSGCDDELRINQVEIVAISFLELLLHRPAHVVEKSLNASVPTS